MKFTKKDLGTFVRITGVLLIITMSVAFLLSFVNGITKDKIAANEAAKTAEAVKALFPDVAAPTPENMNASAEGDLDVMKKLVKERIAELCPKHITTFIFFKIMV